MQMSHEIYFFLNIILLHFTLDDMLCVGAGSVYRVTYDLPNQSQELKCGTV